MRAAAAAGSASWFGSGRSGGDVEQRLALRSRNGRREGRVGGGVAEARGARAGSRSEPADGQRGRREDDRSRAARRARARASGPTSTGEACRPTLRGRGGQPAHVLARRGRRPAARDRRAARGARRARPASSAGRRDVAHRVGRRGPASVGDLLERARRGRGSARAPRPVARSRRERRRASPRRRAAARGTQVAQRIGQRVGGGLQPRRPRRCARRGVDAGLAREVARQREQALRSRRARRRTRSRRPRSGAPRRRSPPRRAAAPAPRASARAAPGRRRTGGG